MTAKIIMLLLLSTITYTPDELTTEQLTTRTTDNIIIEHTTGIVTDEDMNGIITNTESEYNYISYSDIEAEPGEMINTYFIYNPYTQYEDDILYRIDIDSDGNMYIN